MWWLGWLGHIPNLPHPYSFCLLEPSHLVSCFCLYLYLYPKLYSLKFMACHQSLALIRRHILLLIITVTLEISQPGLYTTEHCSPQNVIVPKNKSGCPYDGWAQAVSARFPWLWSTEGQWDQWFYTGLLCRELWGSGDSVQKDVLDCPKQRNTAVLQKLWESESRQTLIFLQHVADVFSAAYAFPSERISLRSFPH